jgi:hypothetical protein
VCACRGEGRIYSVILKTGYNFIINERERERERERNNFTIFFKAMIYLQIQKTKSGNII